MLKVSARILDIYDDEAGEIARQLPEELHTVKVAERDEIEALPDHRFGLVMKTAGGVLRRRFPLHNADAIKLSSAYFDRVKEDLHPQVVKVAERKFANPSSLEVAYIDVTTLEPQQPKVAFAEMHWGLTIEGHDCFPLHDESLVKLAIARFPFTINDLQPEERFLYARNITKRAETLNLPVPHGSSINLYTANELNKESLKEAIEQRKMAVGSTVGTEILDQLAEAAGCRLEQGSIETDDSFAFRQAKQASVRPLPVDRVITVLQHFDKLAGLNSMHYLRGMLDPFAACFKSANASGVDLNRNMIVDGVDLSKIDPMMLRGKFDDSFVNSFAENPVGVYKSLPDPVKSVIRNLAEQGMSGDQPSAATPTPASAAINNTTYPPGPRVGSGGDPSERLNPSFVSGLY